MGLLDRLLEHDRWATTQLLETSRDLTDVQLDQPFDIGLGTLRETFDHMVYNIGFWHGLMIAQPIARHRKTQNYDRSVPALIGRYERSFAVYASFCRQIRDEQRMDDTFVDHYAMRPTFGGTIIQVATHSAEHRSEAAHILQRLGVADVPEVDHLLWEHTTRGNVAAAR